jgi:hypothetical protein
MVIYYVPVSGDKTYRLKVCVLFVQKDQRFNQTDILHHCENQNLEICAIQLETKISNFILSLYRALSGYFNQFLRKLDATFKYLYNSESEFLICDDININYLNEKSKIKNSLLTHNLTQTMQFQSLVNSETWVCVYKNGSINKVKNGWIIQGIKISCKHKRSLCIYSRSSNNTNSRAFALSIVKF